MRTKKRDDWKLIKKGNFTKEKMRELCSLPLLVQGRLRPDEQYAFMNEGDRIQKYFIDPFNEIRDFLEGSIGEDFLVLQEFSDPDELDFSSYVYCRLSFVENLIQIDTYQVGNTNIGFHCQVDIETVEENIKAWIDKNSPLRLSGEEEYKEMSQHTLTHMSILFRWINKNVNEDKYMVSDHVPNPKPNEKGHRPHIEHDNKPYMRGDLTSVRFLNALPSPNKPSEHKGGTHRSPVAHKRRAHTRILKHPKFKNHPEYMKPKLIPAYWVGDKTSVVGGVMYKVLQRD